MKPKSGVILLALVVSVAAKDKKPVLPESVLRAETVFVMIDPTGGTSISNGDRIARESVEQALRKWGRFHVLTYVSGMQPADLIIEIRKGGNKAMIGGTDPNERPGTISNNGGNINIGVSTSPPPGMPGRRPMSGGPSLGTEAGPAEDIFEVYVGGMSAGADPLDSPPVWRYVRKDALNVPGLIAVREFQKLIEDTEKQRSQRSSRP